MNIFRFVIGESPHGLSPAKCDLFGSVIGAAAQNISDGINWFINSQNNKSNKDIADANNAAAIQIAKDNNLWQEKLLEKNQSWSSAEAERAYKRELEKMRMEQAWNSPVMQVQRLRAAGLNPSLAFGGANTAQVAGASAPQASPVNSGVTPQMPVLSSPRMEAFRMANPTQAFKDMAESFAALAAADKTGMEAKQLEATFDDYCRKIHADTEFAEVGAMLQRKFGEHFKSKELQLLDNQIAEKVATISNLTKTGAYTDALTEVAKVDKLLKENQYAKGETELQYLPDQLRAIIKNIESSSALNSASAQNQISQSKLTDEQRSQLEAMHDFNVRQKAALTQMDEAELRKTAATLDSQIDFMLGHFDMLSESDRVELEKLRSELKIQKNIQNTWWFSYVFDKIERINNGITNWIPFAPDK